MKQHISDKAEVSVDFPEKSYYGTFSRQSSFELKTDEHGIHIDLRRDSGEKRHVGFHIHYHLLADMLTAMGKGLAKQKGLEQIERELLTDAAHTLSKALDGAAKKAEKSKTKTKR